MSVVLILGAGASKLAGAPLMGEFLDVARELYQRNNTGVAASQFKMVFDAINELQQVHSKSQLDIHNIEAVFAAFEMARTLGGFGPYGAPQIEEIATATRTLIVQTLEQTLRFPMRSREICSPVPYDEFAKLCAEIRGEQSREQVAVLTFNYDIGVDFGFHWHGIPVDYALAGKAAGPRAVPLLKLHGSLNWARCAKCGNVVAQPLADYMSTRHALVDAGDVRLQIGTEIGRFKHCGEAVASTPEIVPPTWNKVEYHRVLQPVWSRAAKELRNAHSILVLGFSLPETDVFFKYLYALGTAGGAPLQRFWVFNPDATVSKRFHDLLGPGAQQRFRYFQVMFDAAITEVRRLLVRG
jgi:hypothetical protein